MAAKDEADDVSLRGRAYSGHVGGYSGFLFRELLHSRLVSRMINLAGVTLPGQRPPRLLKWYMRCVQLLILTGPLSYGVSLVTGTLAGFPAFCDSDCRLWSWVMVLAHFTSVLALVAMHYTLRAVFRDPATLERFQDIEIPREMYKPLWARMLVFMVLALAGNVWAGYVDPTTTAFGLPSIMQLVSSVSFLQLVSQAYRVQFRTYLETMGTNTPEDTVHGFASLGAQLRRLSSKMQISLVAQVVSLSMLVVMIYATSLLGITWVNIYYMELEREVRPPGGFLGRAADATRAATTSRPSSPRPTLCWASSWVSRPCAPSCASTSARPRRSASTSRASSSTRPPTAST